MAATKGLLNGGGDGAGLLLGGLGSLGDLGSDGEELSSLSQTEGTWITFFHYH